MTRAKYSAHDERKEFIMRVEAKKRGIPTRDLGKEQVELLAVMERAINPELLAAVERVYRTEDRGHTQVSLRVSYVGTGDA